MQAWARPRAGCPFAQLPGGTPSRTGAGGVRSGEAEQLAAAAASCVVLVAAESALGMRGGVGGPLPPKKPRVGDRGVASPVPEGWRQGSLPQPVRSRVPSARSVVGAGLSACHRSPKMSLALRQGRDSAPSLLASHRQLWSPGGAHPAALLHTRGRPRLPMACVSLSVIYGAPTVCLTVLDIGEGVNDIDILSATYGLIGRVQTSWGQGGTTGVPNRTENQNQQESVRSPWPSQLLNPSL